MEDIREKLQNPLIAGAVGVVVGLLLGILYAWVINPVEWKDASVEHIRADLQDDYLRMAVESYNLTHDVDAAQARYSALGEMGEETMAIIVANPNPQGAAAVVEFRNAIGAEPLAEPVGEEPAVVEEDEPAPAEGEEAAVVEDQPAAVEEDEPAVVEEPAEEEKGVNTTLLLFLCLLTMLIAGGAVGYFVLNQRKLQDSRSLIDQAHEFTSQAERTDFTVDGHEPPLSQFMTTYMLGDDLFDDSFSIDSPSGEFLGECGVGISEVIGVGDPKKVAAFEVWLFDKNDIQTVTKVLMSEHAFSDENLRQRLEAKGEPAHADPGSEMILETETLQLVARIVDMEYGGGPLPQKSFFERVTLELAVWPKV